METFSVSYLIVVIHGWGGLAISCVLESLESDLQNKVHTSSLYQIEEPCCSFFSVESKRGTILLLADKKSGSLKANGEDKQDTSPHMTAAMM